MNYLTYIKMQTAGPVHKPEHYHIAEKKTIDYLFRNIPKDAYILDVGCAMGLAIGYFKLIGYKHPMGIELDKRKVEASEFSPCILIGDISIFPIENYAIGKFDVIYCSHTLEHVYDAEKVIEKMKEITTVDAIFFFVLPYPNPNPSPAHFSTFTLGLDVNDLAGTVGKWFMSKGFVIDEIVHDDFREPEIWLTLRKA